MTQKDLIASIFALIIILGAAYLLLYKPLHYSTDYPIEEPFYAPIVNPNNHPSSSVEYYRKEKERELTNQRLIAENKKEWEEFCGVDNVLESWWSGQVTFSCEDVLKIPNL